MSFLEGTVVSSRIRFARNLRGYRFPSRLKDKDEALEITNKAFKSLSRFARFEYLRVNDAEASELAALKERYIISDALLKSKFGAVAYSLGGDLSVMINEEDHIREQYLVRGGDLADAYAHLSGLDNWLDKTLNFCKNEKLGYLTACPTNLGTGMRASVMTFLPAHVRLNKMEELADRASKLDLTVRGAFGEGSGGDGYLYQISNEVTLGKTEGTMINSVRNFVLEVAEEELELQRVYHRSDEMQVEDDIFRALGTLLYCRKISYDELSRELSEVKLGVLLGLIKSKKPEALDDILVCARPYYLLQLYGEDSCASLERRDELRAKFVRERLKTLIVG